MQAAYSEHIGFIARSGPQVRGLDGSPLSFCSSLVHAIDFFPQCKHALSLNRFLQFGKSSTEVELILVDQSSSWESFWGDNFRSGTYARCPSAMDFQDFEHATDVHCFVHFFVHSELSPSCGLCLWWSKTAQDLLPSVKLTFSIVLEAVESENNKTWAWLSIGV